MILNYLIKFIIYTSEKINYFINDIDMIVIFYYIQLLK